MITAPVFGSYERFIGRDASSIRRRAAAVAGAGARRIGAARLRPLNDYAGSSEDALRGEDTRIELDVRSESIGRKIREAELRKIPYMLVVGEREQGDGTVAVREHHGGDSGQHFRPGVRRAPGGRAILLGIEASEILRAPRLAFT